MAIFLKVQFARCVRTLKDIAHHKFHAEQTVTANTAAAGGNAALLAG
jgi:delta 1-pyrroline-5-carboxylate dehydrogenase